MMDWWWGLIIGILALLAGGVGGFFGARFLIKKHMQDNPPIDREQIKAMYMSMGRKPSEAQINQTMNAFKNSGKKKSK